MSETPNRSQRSVSKKLNFYQDENSFEASSEDEFEAAKASEHTDNNEPPLQMMEFDEMIEFIDEPEEAEEEADEDDFEGMEEELEEGEVVVEQPSTSAAAQEAPAAPALSAVNAKKSENSRTKGKRMLARTYNPSLADLTPLFEGSLDLSKLGEEASLYSIVRKWVNNMPIKAKAAKSNRNDDSSSCNSLVGENCEEILALLESGELASLPRMPKARQTDISLIPPVLPSTQNWELLHASKEELLADNKQRWKLVRNHWLWHNKKYVNERYSTFDKIMDILCAKDKNETQMT